MRKRMRVMTLPLSGIIAGITALAGAGTAKAQPVRGLYVGGSAGASFNQAQRVSPHTKNFSLGRDEYSPGILGLGSVGWGLGNGFRIEAEGSYRNNRYSGFHGSSFPNETSGHQRKYAAMANALFDMDIGENWIYPYFGAGLGYAWQSMNTRLSSTNTAYVQHVYGTKDRFAYQAMLGASLPVPWVVGLSTTMEYRFFSTIGPHRHNATANGDRDGNVGASVEGKRNTRTDFNHALMLGLRYEFDPAPPPPKPAPDLPSAAPAPAPVRTYLVFFDWNSAGLTDRARTIISTAVRNSASAQYTRIEVNGHADASGQQTPAGRAYNQALSLERAKAVQAELVRDGIASGMIDVHAYGATKPLIATAPGMREPQNRRVEIIIR